MSKSKVISIQQPRIARSYSLSRERENNTIGKRIAEERQRAKLSLPEFRKLLQQVGVDVVKEAIRKWEIGENVPNAYQLIAICSVLGIDDVLLNFDSNYLPRLNVEGQEKVRIYADDLAASGKYSPSPVRESVIQFVDMRISNLTVSAGTGAFLDEGSFELMSFPKESVPAGADFGVRVRGDSMEPVYHDGQIVWVQRCDQLRPGEVGVFLYDGEGYLKRYDEWEPAEEDREQYVDSDHVLHRQPVLISYNSKYEPKKVSPNSVFQIAGRVLN